MERLWGSVKRTTHRPGIRARFLIQYLARFQFMHTIRPAARGLHVFLLEATRLYTDPG